MSVILALVIIAMILLTVKRMYSPLQVGQTVVDKPVQMTYDMTTCNGALTMSGNEHTYSLWFFASNWESGTTKRIFERSYKDKTLQVELAQYHPDLKVTLGGSSTSNPQEFTLKNIRIQAWNHLAFAMYDKTLDVYLNGKLARTFLLSMIVQGSPNDVITIGGISESSIAPINGFISRFIYFPRILSPREIYKTYLKGPAQASLLSSSPDIEMGTEIVIGNNQPACQAAL